MPISVKELFEAAGPDVASGIRGVDWNATKAQIRTALAALAPMSSGIRTTGARAEKIPGVYVVCLSDKPSRNEGLLLEAPIDPEKIGRWIEKVPEAAAESISVRRYWLPDESILYIGETNSLCRRLRQLFRHELGNSSPHAGGHWVQTLRDSYLRQLHVWFVVCSSKEKAQNLKTEMLKWFSQQAQGNALPFANRV